MPWIQKQGSFEPYNCILVTQIASLSYVQFTPPVTLRFLR